MLYRWKTLIGTCVYQNATLAIHHNLFYRWMIFSGQKGVVQTMINRYYPEHPILPYLIPLSIAARAQPGRTCLLGLGGGGIAHYLTPWLRGLPLTAVEADSQVIQAAKTYFMLDRLPNLNIVHQDAQTFVLQTPHSYQHLLIDLFDPLGYPRPCAHAHFFQACRDLLLPNGILALNLTSQDIKILDRIQSVFQNATVCIPLHGTGNVIVLASAKATPLLKLLQQQRGLKKLYWDSLYGYTAQL